jgi:hypothetical protein
LYFAIHLLGKTSHAHLLLLGFAEE